MKHFLLKSMRKTNFGSIIAKYMVAAVAVSAYWVAGSNDAQASCRAYGPQPGMYVNVDPNTREITRFRLNFSCNDVIAIPADATPAEREAIRRRAGARWSLQMWGKCHPRDCAWGTAAARPAPSGSVENLLARYNQGFAQRRVVLRLYASRVQLIVTSRYRDGRPTRKTSSFFRRTG